MDPTQRKRAREDGFEDWSMTFHKELDKKVFDLVHTRELKPLDVCVVSYLQTQLEVKTGRIEVRTKDIAERLCLTESHLTASMTRLRKQGILAKGLRGTGYYWMLNPSCWHVGGPRTFQKRAAQFDELLK